MQRRKEAEKGKKKKKIKPLFIQERLKNTNIYMNEIVMCIRNKAETRQTIIEGLDDIMTEYRSTYLYVNIKDFVIFTADHKGTLITLKK
jgi:hypothetical protein